MSRQIGRFALGRILFAFVLCAAAPRPAAAQPLDTVRVTAPERAQVEADALEARAGRLAVRPGGWRDAAALERRAARLRGDDPRAVATWTRAAWLYAGAGRLGQARRMMEEAARIAERGGDVERAAAAYLDAALIAAEDARPQVVATMLHRMRRVAASPLLPEDRRAAILARVHAEPRLAARAPE